MVKAAEPKRIPIADALRQASQHFTAGHLPQAEGLLRQVLAAQPRNAAALHLLGAVAHQAGKTELGIPLIRQALEMEPTAGEFRSNLAEMHRFLGQLDDAIREGELAVTLQPTLAAAHSNLGVAYFDKGELDKAEACQKQALALNPAFAAALNNLGSIERERKNKEAAVEYYRKALKVNPRHLDALNNLGVMLNELERSAESVETLLALIKLAPNFAEAHCNIANAFLGMEKLDKAEIGFRRALELKPAYPEAHRGMAKTYEEQQKLPDAEACALKAVALEPGKAEGHSLLGEIYTLMGYPQKAEAAYARAIALDPGLVNAYLGRGQLQMELGRMAEAEADFRHGLSLDAKSITAKLSLAQVKKIEPGDGMLAALEEEAMRLSTMPETKAIPLHFALGKCYDDTRQADRAFAHYLEGCRLKRSRLQYSADNNERAVENITKLFSRENIDALRSEACASELPIFVLGMPRSGTTLTEQIIASHPDVHGAGELPDLLALAAEPEGKPTEGYPHSLKGMTQGLLKNMGERYAAGLRARDAEARHITDKMPANFNALGLIHLMLPNAKIIHVKRNPVDTCLSGFTRLFHKSQHHSYDLAEIGRYYRSYAGLMEHWRQVLPKGAFYEVQYEDLVADTEAEARALIAYCGLAWNDACLEFHKNARSIRTASVTQVRQPIYTSSVARWRQYEKHLGPLLKELGVFS